MRSRRFVLVDFFAAGTHARSFNLAGELQTEQITGEILDGVSVNVGYDSFLRRNSLQSASGANTLSAQTYSYDSASRLQTVTSGSQTATYAHYPNSGLLNTTTFTSGTQTNRSYDSIGRLQTISTTTPAAGTVASYTTLTTTSRNEPKSRAKMAATGRTSTMIAGSWSQAKSIGQTIRLTGARRMNTTSTISVTEARRRAAATNSINFERLVIPVIH
jgi:hypothetical protein